MDWNPEAFPTLCPETPQDMHLQFRDASSPDCMFLAWTQGKPKGKNPQTEKQGVGLKPTTLAVHDDCATHEPPREYLMIFNIYNSYSSGI